MLTVFRVLGIQGTDTVRADGFESLVEKNAMIAAFIRDMPVWKVVSMSRGEMSEERLDALIARARQ